MDHGEAFSMWDHVREQLITLWAFSKQQSGSCDFETCLTQEFSHTVINLSLFNQICYFLLGIINKEQRDKLISWPIVNIQGQVKFRKGVSSIVKNLIEKYPSFNLRRLPESYLMDPNGNQKKILDFIMKLANIAIYSAMNNPTALVMLHGEELTVENFETAQSVVTDARLYEEKVIKANQLPLDRFLDIKSNMTKKCVMLKQENSKLNGELNRLKTSLIEKGLGKKNEPIDLSYLSKASEENMEEVKQINDMLEVYNKAGNRVLSSLRAVRNPVYLKAKDIGLREDGGNLSDNAVEACDRLQQIFDYLKLKEIGEDEKVEYLEGLQKVKNALLKERTLLHSFIEKHSSINNAFT